MCLLCQRQNSLPSDLCVTVHENEGCVELGSINAELGEMTELSPSSKGRLEDVQVCFLRSICFLKVMSDRFMGLLGHFPKRLQYYHKKI